ncbi:hypothetical protein CC80DRAFT_99430 [Byssothecium circinans]|uniref:Uncharacterized protein n=1 Tax=Byssothecium circinans TaxID=147558 RepID=A0A6A5UCG8_9PLEO|nr:hypothetical protein CC80DRAFT_99430 [Byssothecium circinans]
MRYRRNWRSSTPLANSPRQLPSPTPLANSPRQLPSPTPLANSPRQLPAPALEEMTELSQIADRERIISEATEVCMRHLQSEWGFSKAPRLLVQQFQQARLGGETDTARIFLDAGFQAWFAYFLATKSSQGGSHYTGQRAEQHTISALQQLSTTDKKTVATALANTEVHATVQAAIEELTKRHRLQNTELSVSTSPSTTSPTMQPVNATQDMIETASNNAAEPVPTTIMFPGNICSPPRDIPNSAIEPPSAPDQQTASHPATERIASMFSTYLRGAIRKHGDRAAVSITLYSHLPDGLLSLVILPSRVQYLAHELFGINVEIEGQLRYVVQANGCKLVPKPEITLEGARGEAMPQLFGEWVTRGIEANLIRIEEAKQGLPASCVTMHFTSNQKDDAYLHITMGSIEVYQMYETLFR